MDELATLQKIDATAIEPKIILDVIEAERRKKAGLAGICKVDRTLVRTKGREVKIPQVGISKAIDIGEGVDITTAAGLVDVTFTTVVVRPTKIGHYFKVTTEQINAQEIDIVNYMVRDSGRAIADKEDDRIRDALLASDAASSTLAAASSTLAFEDLIAAKARIAGKKFAANLVILSPLRADDIVKDATRFIEVAEIGREALVEGAIGRYAGLDVLVSNAMPDSSLVVLDRDAAPWLVLRRETDLKRKDMPEADSIAFYAYREMAAKVTQPDGLVIITMP